jgi:hypothetical protein
LGFFQLGGFPFSFAGLLLFGGQANVKNDGPIEAAIGVRGCSSLIFPREWEVLEQR